jgi:hypothetical protein
VPNPSQDEPIQNSQPTEATLDNEELDEVSGGTLLRQGRAGPGFVASDPDNGDAFHGSDFNQAKDPTWP